MKQLKTCIYILFALSFLTFILTFLVFSKRENEKAKRMEAEAQLAVVKEEKDRVAEAYESAKVARDEAQNELKKELRRAQELEQQVIIEKKEKERLAGQVSTLTGDLDSLNKEYKESQGRYERLARIAKSLKKKFEDLKKHPSGPGVELPTLVVNPTTEVQGRVLVVNDVFRFVVVNVGRQNGLSEGMTLGIVRDSGQIGRVQVEKLYDSMAACSIIEQDTGNLIQVHDLVKSM